MSSTDATNSIARHGNALTARQRGRSAARYGPYNGRHAVVEPRGAGDYPISRWYLRPAAARLAAVLSPTRVRPVHLTCCGLMAAAAAAAVLLWRSEATPLAAVLVLVYWFFDRADGLLARCQRTASAWGTWLDGNADELMDVALHVATALVVAWQVSAAWPWWLLAAFLAGKYLLMYGLALEEHASSLASPEPADSPAAAQGSGPPEAVPSRSMIAALRHGYHLPGNADVRVHLLVLALATGWLAAELAWVALYYNLRWITRYLLVARRLGGLR